LKYIQYFEGVPVDFYVYHSIVYAILMCILMESFRYFLIRRFHHDLIRDRQFGAELPWVDELPLYDLIVDEMIIYLKCYTCNNSKYCVGLLENGMESTSGFKKHARMRYY